MARKSRRSSDRVGQRSPEPVSTPPREVVLGIRLEVSGRELVVRLGQRIRWHRDRGDALIEEMKKLGAVERDAETDLETILGKHDSPRTRLEKKLREHRERATFLTFLRDHLRTDQLYRLDSTDLRITEILPEKPW